MLSDEEREALEILNNTEWNGFMITIKNLIKKQSKEIEELKNADLTTVYLNGVYDGEKKVQDRIKAKMEEVKDGTYDAKIVLQSLLEKE